MKTLIVRPGKVGPLSTYLNYLFLRFPGTLGPEQRTVIDCFDTYDRRWSRQGQVWIGLEGGLRLVTPPSLDPLAEDPSTFGLQAPQRICKVAVRSRPVTFESSGETVTGQTLKIGTESYLFLKGNPSKGFAAIESALVADGLVPVPAGEGWWVKDKQPLFEGPRTIAPPGLTSPAAPFLLESLRDGLRVARQYEQGTRDDVDTECLHQYRVHLRRVRSLAGLGRWWEVVPEWDRLKNLLRELQQRTNELRDLDVLLLELPNYRATLPWGEGVRLDGWEASLVRRREAQWRQVKAWLDSEEHRAVHGEIDKLFDDLARYGEPWTVAELTTSAFDRSARGLKKALKVVRADSPDEHLHEVRIRTKRLRYVLDGLGFLGPKATIKVLTTVLKQSQEGLGQFQDRSILLERLGTEVAALRGGKGIPTETSGIDLLAFGILIGTLAAEHRGCKAEAFSDVTRLKSASFSKALRLLTAPEATDGS